MKSFHSLILVAVVVISASAQSHSFTFSRFQRSLKMSSSEHNIFFERYNRKDGMKERQVIYDGVTYTLEIQRYRSSLTKVLKNANDSIVATVFMNGINENSVLLSDSRLLKWKKVSSGETSYTLDGRQVVTCELARIDDEKGAVVDILDRTIPGKVMQIVCLEGSVEKLKRNPLLATVGASGVLAVVLGLLAL